MSQLPQEPGLPASPQPDSHSESRGLFKSARHVAALTLLSRITGLARDTVCAMAFGGGPEFSAFVFAFMIPNLFRRLLGEGALSAAFIPTFANVAERDGQPAAWQVFRKTLGALIIALAGICAVLYILSFLLAPRLASNPNWQFVFPLINTLIPFLPLICIIAFLDAALQAKNHFILPATSPVIINLFWIAGAILALYAVLPLSSRIFFLPAAVLAGAALALVLHLPILRRFGAPLKPAFRFHDPALRDIALKVSPAILGLSIVQINVFVDGLIARSLISDVANSNLYFPNRVFQFPLAMLGISVGTAAFPTLSRMLAQGRSSDARRTATQALAVALFLALPAACAMILLAKPVLALLFQHGRLSADQTAVMGPVLAFYAIGLPAACANQILVRLFYTVGDTRTPVRIAVVAMFANLALNLTLVWPLREGGLALATSISGSLQLVLLFAAVQRRLRMLESGSLLNSLARSLALALAAAVFIFLVFRFGCSAFNVTGLAARALNVFLPLFVGAVAYIVPARLLRFPELSAALARR